MNYKLKMMELDELRKLLNKVGKSGAGKSGAASLKAFLKSNYRLSPEETAQVVAYLEGKERQDSAQDEQQEIVSQINGYLEVLQMRPRKYDAENPDIAKLKTLVANRKSMLKRKAAEEGIELE